MGKLMSNYGTQVKERARQQKQAAKAEKRMLARQKKAFAKANPPSAGSDTAEPVSADYIVEGTDSPIRP